MTTAITLQIFGMTRSSARDILLYARILFNIPFIVIVLVVIAGTSLLFFRRKRRRACYAKSHGSEGRKRGDGNLFSKIGRQAGLSGGKRHNEVAGEKDSTSVSVHKLDVDEQPPVQQIPERVLVRESLDAPKWLPQLPSHQDIGLHNSVATAAPPSRGSLAQSNPTGTLQRLRENLTVAEDPISLPPRALFTRQSTVSSNYSESVVSSAPSSRPSTIVYASPLRPRPTARNAPR